MPIIVIKATHHELESKDLTGLQFVYELDHAKGWVSIQGMPPLSFQDRLAAYRMAIEGLAQELLRAAQNPQWITESHEPQESPSNS